LSRLLELSTHECCTVCGVEICARCSEHIEEVNQDPERHSMMSGDLLKCIQSSPCECDDGPAVPMDLEDGEDEVI
jgi:hypothetical protein